MSDRAPMPPVKGLKPGERLSPPPARRPQPPPVRAVPAGEPGPTGDVEAGSKASRRRSAPRQTTVKDAAGTRPAISISVPPRVAQRWRDRARTDGTSQPDVLMDALVAHQSQLTELVSSAGHLPTVSDGLFERTPAKAGEDSELHVTMSLRLLARNLKVIDRLVAEHKAKSRSQLAAVALDAYLGE